MWRTEATKALITLFNISILCALPFWGVWHTVRIRKFKHASYDWWSQILTVVCYVFAINAELPAFLSRLIAYYIMGMNITGLLYSLNTWDRWGHVLFYGMFILYTWVQTKKRVPQYITDSFADE